jgi:hypothetical protein
MIEDYSKPFKYEETWRDKDRKDLTPPKVVMRVFLEKEPRRSDIPFEVSLDSDRLRDILREEGTTNGRSVYIVFDEKKGGIKKMIETNGDTDIRGNIEAALGLLKDPYLLGQCGSFRKKGSRTAEARLVKINLGNIYDLALLTTPSGDNEDLKEKFHKLATRVLVHEIGHTRQPDGIHKGSLQTAMRIVKGSWVMLDVARRIPLPWMGIFEPMAVAVEGSVARAIGQKYYSSRPQEKFAREYVRDMGPLFEDVIRVEIRSEEQLNNDNYWRKVKKSLPLSFPR